MYERLSILLTRFYNFKKVGGYKKLIIFEFK